LPHVGHGLGDERTPVAEVIRNLTSPPPASTPHANTPQTVLSPPNPNHPEPQPAPSATRSETHPAPTPSPHETQSLRNPEPTPTSSTNQGPKIHLAQQLQQRLQLRSTRLPIRPQRPRRSNRSRRQRRTPRKIRIAPILTRIHRHEPRRRNHRPTLLLRRPRNHRNPTRPQHPIIPLLRRPIRIQHPPRIQNPIRRLRDARSARQQCVLPVQANYSVQIKGNVSPCFSRLDRITPRSSSATTHKKRLTPTTGSR
jgi:hypothetical protein